MSALKVVEPNLPNVKTSLENGDEDFSSTISSGTQDVSLFFSGFSVPSPVPQAHPVPGPKGGFEVHTFSAGPLRSPCPAQLHRRGRGTKLTSQGNGSNIGSGNGPAKLEFQDLTIRYHPCSSLFLIHLSQIIIHLASISYHFTVVFSILSHSQLGICKMIATNSLFFLVPGNMRSFPPTHQCPPRACLKSQH